MGLVNTRDANKASANTANSANDFASEEATSSEEAGNRLRAESGLVRPEPTALLSMDYVTPKSLPPVTLEDNSILPVADTAIEAESSTTPPSQRMTM